MTAPAALANLGAAAETIDLTAGINLGGGGDLTANRTFDVTFPFVVLDTEVVAFGSGTDVSSAYDATD